MSAEKQAFRRATWAGVATLLVAVGLLLLFPMHAGPLPSGMSTPIIAFELARSSQEVEQLFGPPASPERALWASAMDRGNLADYLFMVCYGAYLWLFSRALARDAGRAARFASWLAPLPSLMDALENVQLLAITGRLGADYTTQLARLAWFAWLKFLLLTLVLTLWAPELWRLGKLGRAAAAVCLLSAACALAALFMRGLAAELMGLGITVSLLCTFVLSVRRSRP